MKTIYLSTDTRPTGSFAATIGFFDGVHRGHRHVISTLSEMAHERGLQTMVITFDRHPRLVVQPEWKPQLLTSLDEKLALLEETGVDAAVVLPFDERMAQLSARDFMTDIMQRQLGVNLLLTGYDNKFGHNRAEGFDDYRRYGEETGMEVVCATPLSVSHNVKISSSLVRRLLMEGDVDGAASCLGRHYSVRATVVHGHQVGRTMGYPTANLQPTDDYSMMPAAGVYAVDVDIDGAVHRGMMNIGTRPTFMGHHQTAEVNIFDFNGNLYDHTLTVTFLARLRNEQHFYSPDELALQLEKDEERARNT